jgi:hypothetical protein
MKVSLMVAPVLVGALVGGVMKPIVTPERDAPSAATLSAFVEAALEHGDLRTALRTTEAAHRLAAHNGRWEFLLEVGDAYAHIARRPGAPEAASQRAHEAYRAALRSARRAESLDGVLRVAEAFAQLGDPDAVESSLRVARALAGPDGEAVADVQAATGRFGDLLHVAPADDWPTAEVEP